MKTLRGYQIDIADEGLNMIRELGICYLALEVRLGKTSTAMEIARLGRYKRVLFLTKKKAISSIEDDYKDFNYNEHFDLTVINNESMHKVTGEFDLLISDEHHRSGAFPKPNVTTKLIRKMYGHLPHIYLSGTPFAESYSQIYHQFWVSHNSPFKEYKNFYRWCDDYVEVFEVDYGYGKVRDYSKGLESALEAVEPYMIRFTQKDAGFETEVKEHVLYCDIKDSTHQLIKKLRKDKVVEGEREVILAETAVKMQGKIHQLYSGTIKFKSGNSKVLDHSKAEFIHNHFKDTKIAIFYKYVAELQALKDILKDTLTTDLDTFNTTDKNIALQVVSGREGISLKAAKYLVYYNIDFSAVTYFQSKDRMTTMQRKSNEVYWIFAKDGIESKIYEAVMKKKSYTLKLFKKDYE